MPAQTAGSDEWRSQPTPKWRVSKARIGGAIHVGRCTAFVTWVIGTSSTVRLGNISCHISRATEP